MAWRIDKPSWLRSAFSHLNWDIFTWHIYVGDFLESGVDWVVDRVNDFLGFLEVCWNFIQVIWGRVIEFVGSVATGFNILIQQIWNWLGSVPGRIADAVSAVKSWALGAIDTVKGWVNQGIAWVQQQVNRLSAWWSEFKSSVLPGILEKIPLVGQLVITVQAIQAIIKLWTGVMEEIILFAKDPRKWVVDKAMTIFDIFCDVVGRLI